MAVQGQMWHSLISRVDQPTHLFLLVWYCKAALAGEGTEGLGCWPGFNTSQPASPAGNIVLRLPLRDSTVDKAEVVPPQTQVRPTVLPETEVPRSAR